MASTRATRLRAAVLPGSALVLVVAMALDTRVVHLGAGGVPVVPGAFSPSAFGAAEFPKVRLAVERKAVDAATLAAAIAKDPAAAGKQYGVASDAGPEFAVKFVGAAGKSDGGDLDVAIPGVPGTVHVEVQTGPAIIGTDLRDATGTITFGQFTNQIVYQNVGAALNKAMKKAVLAPLDTAHLSGKTLSVVGVFQLTDPTNWVVTPVELHTR